MKFDWSQIDYLEDRIPFHYRNVKQFELESNQNSFRTKGLPLLFRYLFYLPQATARIKEIGYQILNMVGVTSVIYRTVTALHRNRNTTRVLGQDTAREINNSSISLSQLMSTCKIILRHYRYPWLCSDTENKYAQTNRKIIL